MKNIWCAPDQDYQHIIELHRVTHITGEYNRLYLYDRKIPLPLKGLKYHVFTADRLHPERLRLLSLNPDWLPEVWFNIGDVINNTSCVVNVYNEIGIEIPKYQSWYMLTHEGALLFAFEDNSKVPVNYKSEIVYVRTYTNAFYSSMRDHNLIDTSYSYKKIFNTGDMIAIQTEYNRLDNLPGYVYSYINGVYTDKIDLGRLKVGDYVEVIYDSSVEIVTRFKVGDLDTFNSTLDSKYKYLLLRNDSRDDVIDYLDDVDIHVINRDDFPMDRYKGVYYHRNDSSSIRMLTHRDYSLSVDNVANCISNIKTLLNSPGLNDLEFIVEVKIRNSGFNRPLIFEDHRIHELYKLSYIDKFRAMVDLNSIDIWKAENLEDSWYSRLMGIEMYDFNISNVEQALGYNAISKVLGDTPTKTHTYSGRQRVIPPQGLCNNTTFFEYDSSGELLEYHYQAIGSQYLCNNNNSRLVEGVYGKATDRPELYFGNNNVNISTTHNYRVYKSRLIAPNVSDNNWVDVTDDFTDYEIVDNKIVNRFPNDDSFFMVRTDKSFVVMDMLLDMTAGMLYFDLAELENRGDGLKSHLLPVPMGQIDIFLNGKSLIRDLDYFIDFPRVNIVAKEHYKQPTQTNKQHVLVRMNGFCNKDLSWDEDEDVGFVEHTYLSNNNRFNVRDDKVLRITVGGYLKTRSDIEFSEEHSGVHIVDSRNGRPYQIKDIVVPILAYNDTNIYDMRKDSIVTDKVVEDYLTLKLPQPPRNAISAIPNRYVLISPFFSRIIERMLVNQIKDVELTPLDNDTKILQFFSVYDELLEFDPIRKDINQNYVIIHPYHRTSVISLTLIKMRILNRLVVLYGDNKITLSPFIQVQGS